MASKISAELGDFLHRLLDHVGAGALHGAVTDLEEGNTPEKVDGKEDTTNA